MKQIIISILCLLSIKANANCPTGTTSTSEKVENKPVCVVEGVYKGINLTMTPDKAWVLKGDVRFGGDQKDNSTLTLEAGTVVYGSPQSFITITRDSKIFAKGTSTKPVVFTSLERANPVPGYWGGIVITGNAKINNCKNTSATGVCEGFIEGVASDKAPKYGGLNDDDSSGSIEYMRVEYGGYSLTADNELNNITFYAVGRGTQVHHLEAYKGADDGIEMFGGTVNLKHIVSVDNDDDGFDWDQGYSGAVQFMYITVENATEPDPNGIEADNFKDNHSASPRSNPVLSNVTIVGQGNNAKMLNGIMLRRGTGVQIYNSIIQGNFQNCLNVDDSETFKNGGLLNGDKVEHKGLVFQNVILQCSKQTFSEDATKDLWSLSKWFSNEDMSNYVAKIDEKVIENLIPVAKGAAAKTGLTPPEQIFPGQFEFLQVDYVGAFGLSVNKWTDGWAKL